MTNSSRSARRSTSSIALVRNLVDTFCLSKMRVRNFKSLRLRLLHTEIRLELLAPAAFHLAHIASYIRSNCLKNPWPTLVHLSVYNPGSVRVCIPIFWPVRLRILLSFEWLFLKVQTATCSLNTCSLLSEASKSSTQPGTRLFCTNINACGLARCIYVRRAEVFFMRLYPAIHLIFVVSSQYYYLLVCVVVYRPADIPASTDAPR